MSRQLARKVRIYKISFTNLLNDLFYRQSKFVASDIFNFLRSVQPNHLLQIYFTSLAFNQGKSYGYIKLVYGIHVREYTQQHEKRICIKFL